MEKKAFAVVILILVVAAPAVGAWSLNDLLKNTASHALELFKREVMPVDGYKALKVGEGFWIEGEHFWNPDYYVQLNSSQIYWSYLIPTDVNVKVRVWKVYFGIFAFPVENDKYNDIWWKKAPVGDGWIGAFFVWDFSWRPGHGWRKAGKAYIAYNLPSANDMSTKNAIENVTILQNGSVRVFYLNGTTQTLDFSEFEGLGNITAENVTFRHLIGSLYLVKRG